MGLKQAVIITGHFPFQKRRGSVWWVSHHLQKMGWHVTHVTVGYSWLSLLKPDQRLRSLGYKPKPGKHQPTQTLTTIYGLSPIHPVKTPSALSNSILASAQKLFCNYWRPRLRDPLANADLVLCESGAPVLLAPLLSDYAPTVPRIYRVNDDIRLLNAPKYLVDAELTNSSHFTRISTASPVLKKRFAHQNITLDPMGIPKKLLATTFSSPFTCNKEQMIAVCAGTSQLDQKALFWTAKNRPNWEIHVLGRIKSEPRFNPTNMTFHGEINFKKMLAYVAHADIGLAPYSDRAGIEYQTTNSNRMLLYRHFGLPILGPDSLCDPNIPSIIGYNDPNAFDHCETMENQPEVIPDWSDLAAALAQNDEIVPPTEVERAPATSE